MNIWIYVNIWIGSTNPTVGHPTRHPAEITQACRRFRYSSWRLLQITKKPSRTYQQWLSMLCVRVYIVYTGYLYIYSVVCINVIYYITYIILYCIVYYIIWYHIILYIILYYILYYIILYLIISYNIIYILCINTIQNLKPQSIMCVGAPMSQALVTQLASLWRRPLALPEVKLPTWTKSQFDTYNIYI